MYDVSQPADKKICIMQSGLFYRNNTQHHAAVSPGQSLPPIYTQQQKQTEITASITLTISAAMREQRRTLTMQPLPLMPSTASAPNQPV